jgi:NAD(P)-dependent dehydrogenase (short-subunit alcohol dehydrogenase family)
MAVSFAQDIRRLFTGIGVNCVRPGVTRTPVYPADS